DRERRIREKWERTSWSHIAILVVGGAVCMGAFGYFLRGWPFALALAAAILIALTPVMVAAKRHPEQVARGERPRSTRRVLAAFLVLAGIGLVVALVLGEWGAAARAVAAIVLIGIAHLVRRRWRAREETSHATGQ